MYETQNTKLLKSLPKGEVFIVLGYEAHGVLRDARWSTAYDAYYKDNKPGSTTIMYGFGGYLNPNSARKYLARIKESVKENKHRVVLHTTSYPIINEFTNDPEHVLLITSGGEIIPLLSRFSREYLGHFELMTLYDREILFEESRGC